MDSLKVAKGNNCKLQNREIRFEVTNLCNSHCIMCPRERITRPQGILDMGLYMRALEEAYKLGAEVVSLENYGESFLDPFFFERAAYAKAKGMSVFTITNGLLFDKKLADKSFYLLDKIRFSVYGTTKEVYESIHIGLKFDVVISNIKYFLEERKRRALRTPRIEVYFLVMEENKHQVDEFKKMWLGYADDISIWKPHNWSDGKQFRKLSKTDKKISCGRPTHGPIQVQWDGLVVPCCFDYNSSIVLGDLNKQSLCEIVSDGPYNRLRKAHKEGDFSLYPFCNSCDQLVKREDVLIFSTIKKARVGAVNTTFDALNGE